MAADAGSETSLSNSVVGTGSVGGSATGGSRSARRSRRRWRLRLTAVLLGLVPFVLLEIAFRYFGVGYDTQLVCSVPGASDPDLKSLNPAVDRAYFGRGDLPGPEPRPFLLPKPAGVYRIVVVGGSSVAGFPYPFELSFPRQLEIVLEAQNPGRQFEVLNAGIVAVTSFSEIDLVRQVVDCQPDLVIVHSGHNEFYGIGGFASTAGSTSPALYALLQPARRSRIFQWCQSWLAQPIDQHLLEALPADIAIPLNGPGFRQVLRTYRENLNQMAREAASAGIPLLLTTIPANSRDLSPMVSLRDAALSTEQVDSQTERKRRVTEHFSYHEYDRALQVLRAAREIEPRNAQFAFREAQCLEKLGRNDEARLAYTQAADADGCRFRAPSQFAEIVRKVADQQAPAVKFCDVAAELQARSSLPAPGNDFFLEHVHYNLEGHWAVAVILGEHIQTKILNAEWQLERLPSSGRRDKILGLTVFDHLLGDTVALMVLQIWPLKLAPDSSRHIEFYRERIRRRFADLTELDQRLFADLSVPVMQHELAIAMGSGYEQAGKLDQALKMFEAHIVRRPWEPRGFQHAAQILHRQGYLKREAQILERLQQLVPTSDSSRSPIERPAPLR